MKKSTVSTILTVVGGLGVIATAIFAAKDTPKAQQRIELARVEKGEELTKLETAIAAAPAYIPTAIVATSTIACIFSANILNKQVQASLMSAYALLDSSYKEYKNKVNEMYGEDADKKVSLAVLEDQTEEHEDNDEILLFFDFNTMQYFNATIDEVVQKATLDDGLEIRFIQTPFGTPYDYSVPW